MRLDRLLAIIVKLLNRDRVSAQQLAAEFEVSVRTIYRDMEAINLAGIPIVAFQGNQGGFGIEESFRLDRQVLTLPEITSLLAVVRGLAPALADKQAARAADKISSLVPRDRQHLLQAQAEQMVIDVLPWGTGEKMKQRLAAIQNAIAGQRVLRFTYRNAKSETVARTAEPHTLVLKVHVWYCFAYCRLRKAFRFFRLSRMHAITALKETFNRREQSFRESEKGQPPNLKFVSLKLKFAARSRYRVEDYFEEDQITFLKDGSMVVDLKWPEDDWLYNFLLGYGEDMEVLEPAYVRKKLAEKAGWVRALYCEASPTNPAKAIAKKRCS